MIVLSLFDGKYSVTTEGQVYSHVGKIKELTGKVSKCGYRIILLTVNGRRKYTSVHRLVAESFLDPANGRQVNHINGNKLDNRLSNLEWCTAKENLRHARDTGLLNTCKINMETAEHIRQIKLEQPHATTKALALLFDLKKTQIGVILQNKSWVS
jgi:hypothetical protein